MARGALKAASVLGALLGEEFADRPKKKVTFVSPEISGSSSTTTSEEDNEYYDDGSDSTDANSTIAEAGTDDELTDLEEDNSEPEIANKAGMATTNSSEAPEWSREEDRTIVSMKTEGTTWADIGKELDRGKREVQRRYKTLSSDAEKLGLTAEKLSLVWAAEDDRSKNKKNAKGKGTEGRRSKKADTSKGEDRKKNKSSSSPSKKKTPAGRKTGNSKSKGKTKNKVAIVSSSSSSSTSSTSPTRTRTPTPSSSSSSSSPSSSSSDADAEHWAQQRYLYHEVFGPLYPDQRRLRAGVGWSADDCRTLAVLEARHRALKWMALQSEFYNATGRMVGAEMIRAKFEE